ncbi:MAG: DUF928 domain-containing protein [Pseudomonadota bacterium]|nr:DUF928 domain-containing protein [Pseudomonadota bacterium]
MLPHVAMLLAALAAVDGRAETGAAAVAAQQRPLQISQVYRPPLRGAPKTRTGGATRGPGTAAAVDLEVLAPDHTGRTLKAQPVLYWYLSRPVDLPVEVTLVDEESLATVLEKTLPAPDRGGIQRLSLADHGVRLQPGVEYSWHVALVADPDQRSQDITASATILYQAPSAALQRALDNANPASLPTVLAAEGIWYDAIDVLSRQISAAPGNAGLHRQRAALLEQVELPGVAAADR